MVCGMVDLRVCDLYVELKKLYSDCKISHFGVKDLELFSEIVLLAKEYNKSVIDFLGDLGYSFVGSEEVVREVSLKDFSVKEVVDNVVEERVFVKNKRDLEIESRLREYFPKGKVKDLGKVDISLYWKVRDRANSKNVQMSIKDYVDSLEYEDGKNFKLEYRKRGRSVDASSFVYEQNLIRKLRDLYPNGIVVALQSRDNTLYSAISYLAKKKNKTFKDYLSSLEYESGKRFIWVRSSWGTK